MTRPTARVLALLEVLQAGGTRTVPDLADRLGVDERTVRRYVAHLVDLNVPVESVRGRYGGVRLAPGHRMPPLMLSDDEALAVLLGLVAGRRAGLLGTSGAAAESAAAKLHRVLPAAVGRRVDALLDTVDFTARPAGTEPPATATLLQVAGAVRDRRPLVLDHTGSTGRSRRRTVHPYGVVAHSGRWYVVGADATTGEVRALRVDRIAALQLADGSFAVPAGFDPAAAVLAAIAGAPYRYEVLLRVEGQPDDVAPLFPPGIAAVSEHPRGGARVVIRAERLDWVPGVLAGIGRPFVVEGPAELRPLVRALADQLTAAASGAETPSGAER